MFKNVASQKIQLFAFLTTTGAPVTGDAANITAYVSKDHGSVTVLGDTSATEMDATNAKGLYVFDLTQGETNADELTFSAKSSTSNVSITPRFISTLPTTGILAPATAGRTLVVDASGLADANVVKVGPTGSGTAQTARDIGASVLLSSGTGTGQLDFTSGVVKANLAQILGTALTETGGQIAAAFKKFFDKAAPTGTINSIPDAVAGATGGLFIAGTNAATSVTTALTANITGNLSGSVGSVTGHTAQTGDSYARLGAPAGASVSADVAAVKTDTGNLVTRITSTLFSGITSMAQWLGLLAGKQAGNSTARTEVRATGAGSGTFDETTDSQEALRDRGDAAWTTATGFSTLDAAGVRSAVGLASANLDTQLDALPTAAENADAVWDEALAGHAAGGSAGAALSAATAPSAAAVADAVWDEILSGHAVSGSTGEALSAAGGAGDPWITALPGAYSAGQAGYIVGTNLNATVSSRATQTSVDDLPTNAELATALDPLPTAAENATAVWGAGARSLTVLDEDSTTLDLDATIRAAVGLASANLDTQIGDLPTNAELATSQAAADDATLAAIAGLSIPTAGAVAGAVWDEATSGHVSAGTFGLAATNTDLRGARTVIRGTAAGSATTTTMTPSALSPAGVDTDQFKGRILIFDNDTTTTALRGQATDITANTAAGLPLLTFTALTTAPASGDTFSIV